MTTNPVEPKLTSLSHGGGCGCKIAPNVLEQLTKDVLPKGPFKGLLVGTNSSDDAGVYKLNDEQALVATTDFFMPIVDDPYDFGRIAAANALSDIYAMGGKPIMALALVAMPIKVLSQKTIRAVLAGGASVCEQADIPIAGGHSIDSVEPIYGLAAMGIVHPNQMLRNDTAQAGDVLILTKPLGVGILSAALKKGELNQAGYSAMIASTTQLNTAGALLAKVKGVHAMTDVTGFSLLGHTLEMCRGAGLKAHMQFSQLPWLEQVQTLAKAGIKTGASGRNWQAFGEAVSLSNSLPTEAQDLLTDPQTSGGLLIACDSSSANQVLAVLQQEGFAQAAQIGHLTASAQPAIDVT